MTGRVSFILKSSNDLQNSPNFEFIISFKIFCSSSFLPVAKKNLHFFSQTIFSINLINIFAGILFVGPDPPIPISIFNSLVFILNLVFTNSVSSLFRLIQTLRNSGRFSFNNTQTNNKSSLTIDEAYKILNLDRAKKVTKEEVKKAYTKIQKKIHPDVSPETSRLSAIVNEAKELVLRDIA